MTPDHTHQDPDIEDEYQGTDADGYSDDEYPDDDGPSSRRPSSFSGLNGDSPLDQPLYEDGRLQMFNDVAKDESLATFLEYLTKSPLSKDVKVRLVAQAAAFLSKNYVFSVLDHERDQQMAMDDIEMSFQMAEIGMTRYDMNIDYLTAKANLQSNINIRLRRSKGGLFLKQLNTTRNESVSEERMQADKETRSFRQKIPIIGSFM